MIASSAFAVPERWRLAGWLGGVPAAEWEACADVVLPANVEGLAVRRRDAAGPAGEDASAPSRKIDAIAVAAGDSSSRLTAGPLTISAAPCRQSSEPAHDRSRRVRSTPRP